MLAHTQIADGGVPLYAAATDFGEVFTEEMHSLYLLSFLLTADTDKAEQCFISALDECLEGMGAFMEWARLWARRAVIRQAIRMIKPAPEDTDLSPPVSVNKTAVASPSNNLLAAIVSLSTFERFVSSCRFSKDCQTEIASAFSDARGENSTYPVSSL
jgi:hypothetical protein